MRRAIILSVALLAYAMMTRAQDPPYYSVPPTDRTVRATLSTYPTTESCTSATSTYSDAGPMKNTPWLNGFGNREVRITDECFADDSGEPGSSWGGEPHRMIFPGWSLPGAVSVNGTDQYGYLFTVATQNSQNMRMFLFDPQAMTAQLVNLGNWPDNEVPHAGQWSHTTQGLMFFGGESSFGLKTTAVYSFNYLAANPQPQLIYDFATCPNLTSSSGATASALNVSSDDSIVTAWYGASTFVSFNRNTSACHWVNVETGETDLGTVAIPANPGVHGFGVSGDGGEVIITYGGGTVPIMFWTPATGTFARCNIYGGCGGHASFGLSEMEWILGGPLGATNVPYHYSVGIAPASEYGQPVGSELILSGPPTYNPYNAPNECAINDTHFSWPGLDNVPLAMMSFQDEASPHPNMTPVCPFDFEIDAIATDLSGTVWRLAHTRSTGQVSPTSGLDTDYNGYTLACSQDMHYCAWISNWNYEIGLRPGTTNQYRDDVFVVEAK
jgi:hypothetical protein